MRVLLTGAGGMLGTNIADVWTRLRPADELIRLTRSDVDLSDSEATGRRLSELRPDAIIHAAARVGGIGEKLAHPTRYLLENIVLDSSLLSAAIEQGVRELVYISSGAIYPASTAQPIAETALMTGQLEPANEGYALAKTVGGRICAYASSEFGYHYRAVAPSNLYGAHDTFSLGDAHLIAAAIAKTHDAKVSGAPTISVWGDGTARREFTFAGDLAEWIVANLDHLADWPHLLNLGAGIDHSVREYYEAVSQVVGYSGDLEYDTERPAGVPQRLLDSTAARSLGWDPSTPLLDGIAATYRNYLASIGDPR